MESLETFYTRIHGADRHGSFAELFTDEFIAIHTHFGSFSQMMMVAEIDTMDDFFTPQWNEFVISHSVFTGWEGMYRAACDIWEKRRRAEVAVWN